jgi:hypothetical protein
LDPEHWVLMSQGAHKAYTDLQSLRLADQVGAGVPRSLGPRAAVAEGS